MKQGLILFFIIFCTSAMADELSLGKKQTYISQLKQEITEIDSAILRCEREQRKWKTATIIGGVGTVATGTAAIIQATQINKMKKSDDTKQPTKKEENE